MLSMLPKMPGFESITSVIETVSKLESEKVARYAVKYEADIDFLKSSEEVRTSELVQEVRLGFEKTGSHGASAYIGLYHEATLFNRQAEMLKAGCLPGAEVLIAMGFPLLVDVERSTPEMLERGLVVPTRNARLEMLGLVNELESGIETYISRTVLSKSGEYAGRICKPRTFVAEVRNKLLSKGPTDAEELGLTFDLAESERLRKLMDQRHIDMDEARATVSREIRAMIKKNPRIADLDGPTRLRDMLKDFAGKIGGENVIYNGPISTLELDDLAFAMRGDVPDQLGIYPGYTEAIIRGIKSELPLTN
jgi:hypothetical protein